MEKYYVSGCKDNGSETVTCDDNEAQFWTLYVRDDAGLSQGVIDCVFREDAEAAKAVYVERDALQEQVRALATEAGRMKKAIKQVFPLGVDDENGKIGFSGIAKECYASALETAATDSALREIRAQVLDDMADDCEADWLDTYIDELRSSAARIRAGEQP